ncbi:hypothetical protein ABIE09_002311 [Lysobacter enzymogenes]|uniref:hypothetical protein n=1 Tax=Lysobacter enzymogenes TaxID=69 RepID=UPI0033944721
MKTSQDQQLPSASGRVTFFVLPKKVTKERRFPCFRIKSHYGSMRAQGCATQAIHGLGSARHASCAPPFGSLIACGEFGAAGGGAKSNGNGKTAMGLGFAGMTTYDLLLRIAATQRRRCGWIPAFAEAEDSSRRAATAEHRRFG